MSTETHPDTEPAVDPWDSALEQAATETPEQPRDEQGRYAQREPEPTPEPPTEANEEPRATETPQQAAERRALKVKLDHEEREIDLDALWASEDGRKELKERYEKGYGFDRAVERARQESFRRGQDATVKWLDMQGFRVRQNPAVEGGWEIVPKQAATPATPTPEPVAKPDAASVRARLEHVATYGDENDPAGQIKAIRELARMDAEEAASAKFAAFNEWKAQQERQAQEAQAARQRAQAEAHVQAQIKAAVEARAKSFEGPDQDRQVQRVVALAMAKARTDARDMDDVIAIVHEAANDLDQRREHWLRQVAKPADKPKSPPPSLDGVPTGANGQKPGGQRLSGWNDPRLDAILGG